MEESLKSKKKRLWQAYTNDVSEEKLKELKNDITELEKQTEISNTLIKITKKMVGNGSSEGLNEKETEQIILNFLKEVAINLAAGIDIKIPSWGSIIKDKVKIKAIINGNF